MPSSFAIGVRSAGVSASLALLLLAGCGDDADRATPAAADTAAAASRGDAAGGSGSVDAGASTATEVAELAPLLARAAAPGTLPESERFALEQAMQRLFVPAASTCDGCEVTVSYVDEAAGGDYFRCHLGPAGGEAAAEIQVFHRPGLPDGVARGWARSELAGHPSSGPIGPDVEALFVWPGRFEIRAFARADSLRGGERLAALVERLPLDALARL